MSATPGTVPVCLVVAATRTMGIGLKGTMPWPPLKQEMAYFSRVTKRTKSLEESSKDSSNAGQVNAVIMGRKTWLSIPPKFRPLKSRINVVLSRDLRNLNLPSLQDEHDESLDGPYGASSLRAALDGLRDKYTRSERPRLSSDASVSSSTPVLSRIFIIGGSEVYKAALELPECTRVLMTRIYTDFTCDTFFPLVLSQAGEYEGWVETERAAKRGVWKRKSQGDLDEWTGENVPPGKQEQDGIEWEFELWEREARTFKS